jgi:hypothetical protein
MEEFMDNIFDYKNEYKELYLPKAVPVIINVPEITFVAVDGNGDPNEKVGELKKDIELLYSIQNTIKMNKIYRGGGILIMLFLLLRDFGR